MPGLRYGRGTRGSAGRYGGAREGVLGGLRAQETCAVRQHAGVVAEANIHSCSRSQGICVMHAPQSCGSVCHRSTASEAVLAVEFGVVLG